MQSSSSPQELPSLDIAFELSKRSLDMQDSALDSLDTKIAAVFGAASVIITLVPALARMPFGVEFGAGAFLMVGAVLAYIVCAVLCYFAYRPTSVRVWFDPLVLLEHYAPVAPGEAQRELVAHMGDSFPRNQAVLRRKARLMNRALLFGGAETLLLVLAVLASSPP